MREVKCHRLGLGVESPRTVGPLLAPAHLPAAPVAVHAHWSQRVRKCSYGRSYVASNMFVCSHGPDGAASRKAKPRDLRGFLVRPGRLELPPRLHRTRPSTLMYGCAWCPIPHIEFFSVHRPGRPGSIGRDVRCQLVVTAAAAWLALAGAPAWRIPRVGGFYFRFAVGRRVDDLAGRAETVVPDATSAIRACARVDGHRTRARPYGS